MSVAEIPPGLRGLYDAGGPVIKLRVMRDLLERDESYLDTAEMMREVERSPEARELRARQHDDGSWNHSLAATAVAVLRLCELGLETGVAVQNGIERLLLPSLAKYEAGKYAREDRDAVLYLLARAQRPVDPLVKVHLETVLAEMKLAAEMHPPQPPGDRAGERTSMHAYAAVCCYPWGEDDVERVSEIIRQLHTRAETEFDPDHDEHRFGYWTKEHYLVNPERLFYELELSARLGITHACDATRWMFEEVEARQDADGWVRFEEKSTSQSPTAKTVPETVISWYYPLETSPAPPANGGVKDWTFRAAHIFKMLEYDF